MFLTIFGSFSVFASESSTANVTSSEERALKKIYELASVLDGKHFTTTQRACHNNACNRCYNLNVTSCDWFVDMFGYSVAKKQMPKQYFPNGSSVAPAGWSCFSFSVFAQWYIFSPSNEGSIGSDVSCVATWAKDRSIKFNQATLAAHARPGDAIRIRRGGGGHSVIYVSCDDEGVWVLDSNYVENNMVALHKILYTSRYGSTAISNCGITITRANNYDTVLDGTSCAAIASPSGFEFADISYPTVHILGKSYTIGGTISSGKLIESVKVKILDAENESTVCEYIEFVGRRSFELAGSEIDANTKFGSLKEGIYFLEYTVTDVAGYTESFRSNCFSVYKGEHYCYFGDGVNEGDRIVYTCDVCGRFDIYEIPEASEPELNVKLPEFGAGSSVILPMLPPVVTDSRADIDGNGKIDSEDAIYLLYSCFFGEMYPIDTDCDFDTNDVTNAEDAIYLLYHVFFGSTAYPIGE